jgi:hypothetical protein
VQPALEIESRSTKSRHAGEIAAAHRRLPLTDAVGRALARVYSRQIKISRPWTFPHRRLCSNRHQSLDLDPTGWIRSNPGQYRSNRQDLAFLQKTP